MISEMEWRKRQQLEKEEQATADKADEAYEPDGADEAAAKPNLATSVDDINFFGAIGGGQVSTKGSLQVPCPPDALSSCRS